MEVRDYYETVEQFLREIYHRKVGGIVMVALLEDDEDHDIMMRWNTSAFGLAMAAGFLQMRAAAEYIEINREGENDDQ